MDFLAKGEVYTFGYNEYGQCLVNPTIKKVRPQLVKDIDPSFEVEFVCGGGNESLLVSSEDFKTEI